jgi:hypothetical protein
MDFDETNSLTMSPRNYKNRFLNENSNEKSKA